MNTHLDNIERALCDLSHLSFKQNGCDSTVAMEAKKSLEAIRGRVLKTVRGGGKAGWRLLDGSETICAGDEGWFNTHGWLPMVNSVGKPASTNGMPAGHGELVIAPVRRRLTTPPPTRVSAEAVKFQARWPSETPSGFTSWFDYETEEKARVCAGEDGQFRGIGVIEPVAEKADGEERCESGDPACGPVTHHDSDGVPLCDECWADLVVDSEAAGLPAEKAGGTDGERAS